MQNEVTFRGAFFVCLMRLLKEKPLKLACSLKEVAQKMLLVSLLRFWLSQIKFSLPRVSAASPLSRTPENAAK